MTDPEIYDKLTNFCAYQERCVSDVKKKLGLLKVEKPEYEAYISRLKEDNFLNEERFVKSYVSAHIKKKWGKVKIKAGLGGKGISGEIVKQYLDGVEDVDYQEKLLKLTTDKAPRIKGKDNRDRKMKLMRHLLSKGYSSTDISNAIKQAGVFK